MNTETEIKLWERIVLPTVGDPNAEREAIKLYHDTVSTLREVTRELSSPVATTHARFVSALEGHRMEELIELNEEAALEQWHDEQEEK